MHDHVVSTLQASEARVRQQAANIRGAVEKELQVGALGVKYIDVRATVLQVEALDVASGRYQVAQPAAGPNGDLEPRRRRLALLDAVAVGCSGLDTHEAEQAASQPSCGTCDKPRS